MRIVVADDEPLLVEEIVVYLTEMGHRVVATAQTGQELISLCAEHLPDLVITDISMPDMDGLEAAKRIQAVSLTPIIVVSGHHDPTFIERAKDGNVMSYLVKPINATNLRANIEISSQRFRELNALLLQTDELQRSLAERKLIERAKGVLMQRTGLTEHEAHRRLQDLASIKNRKIVAIAQSIIEVGDAFDQP
ncbi:ANTAR domain-containing response regulator [Botrimarina colliarenosi]|uniref:ANTAR domain-containing response regulator n=1 Tax=Botrimarina colliarenosi TaxID=2528001 RepID=UPI0018D3A7EB|nr:response regulator [Botrimarina colliarenosi]